MEGKFSKIQSIVEELSKQFVDDLGVGCAASSLHDLALDSVDSGFLAGLEFLDGLGVAGEAPGPEKWRVCQVVRGGSVLNI